MRDFVTAAMAEIRAREVREAIKKSCSAPIGVDFAFIRGRNAKVANSPHGTYKLLPIQWFWGISNLPEVWLGLTIFYHHYISKEALTNG